MTVFAIVKWLLVIPRDAVIRLPLGNHSHGHPYDAVQRVPLADMQALNATTSTFSRAQHGNGAVPCCVQVIAACSRNETNPLIFELPTAGPHFHDSPRVTRIVPLHLPEEPHLTG